jgi:fumarylacetoacetase
MAQLDQTHDPNRRSWVETANGADTDFPIQNLPFGVFSRAGEPARGGVAIGDQIVDLTAALRLGLFSGVAREAAEAATGPALNPLLALGRRHAAALRGRLSELLLAGGTESGRAPELASEVLVPMRDATMHLPARIEAFSDFSCSIYHTRRMGGGNPRPVFEQLPVAYNGRASSIRPSGTPVRRPLGQFGPSGSAPQYGPEPSMDFELEFGAFVGPGNALGEPIPITEAEAHIFGYCLVNDWSARGIQFFESALGPFLGKSFLTSVSPWVVTAEAMAPFRVPAPRGEGQRQPPAYLDSPQNRDEGGLDIELTASLLTPRMRAEGAAPARIVRANFKHMFWTMAQMLTHHASNGCNLSPGDLIASGTVSGPEEDSKACLAEINSRGETPLTLPNGETRNWLENGDEVSFAGRAHREGAVDIGFGICTGRVEPATVVRQ